MGTCKVRGFSAIVSLAAAALLSGCSGEATTTEESGTASAPLTSSQNFLVSFVNGGIPSNADAIVAAAGGTVVSRLSNVGVVVARSSSASFASSLRADARVDAVGLSTAVSSQIAPKESSGSHRPPARESHVGADPLANRQWDMDQIQAPEAHAITKGKSSVLVGVLDSGIDQTHPDLAGQVVASASASCIGGVVNTDPAVWANDNLGHGTHVSGIIAGKRNGVGIVGVAPGVKVAGVKLAVDDPNDPNFGLVFADAFVCALDWAIQHDFDVMNASLTIDPFTGPVDDIFCSDDPDRAAIVRMVRRAVQATSAKRIPLVASAGNDFHDLSALQGSTGSANCKMIPVQLPRVIGVSALGVTQQLAWYSNYGRRAVDLAGPGGDNLIPNPLVTDTSASGQVLSSIPPNSLFYQFAADWDGQVQDCSSGTCATYAYLFGTSMAAPHVTGVAALAISKYGRMSPEALLGVLSATATHLPCPASPYDPGETGQPATCETRGPRNNFYGAGEVNALAVVQ
jgi:subtilisin family serine protease